MIVSVPLPAAEDGARESANGGCAGACFPDPHGVLLDLITHQEA